MKRYPTPKRHEYNLVVIGGGSAGLVSAYIAATVKARVALIEKHKMGGDCLNTGCVPSKALIRSAQMLAYARRAREFGFKSSQVDFDFADVMERVQRMIRKIEPHDSVDRYQRLGVECIAGEAKILSPYQVQVGDRVLTTKNIVVATGASASVPAIPGLDQLSFLTNETIWSLRALPKRLLILGGGAVGCELGQCFQRFGSQVTIVEQASRILGREDDEVSAHVLEKLGQEGVRFLLEHGAKRFVRDGGVKALISENQGVETRIEFDEVLVATGRRANVKGFGLEELGVEISAGGTIVADPYLRTNYPNIFACGDVTGPHQFTHVASHQAWHAVVNALFGVFRKYRVNYRVIPRAIFTDPEVASVGIHEREARAKGIAYEVTRFGLDDLDRAIVDGEDHGFIKVLTVPRSDRILGVTIVGARAADIIVEYVTAMKYGLGLNKILSTVHLYPSFGEANKFAAGVWKRNHAPQALLRWVQRFHEWRRGAVIERTHE